jgi:hypothetical protein
MSHRDRAVEGTFRGARSANPESSCSAVSLEAGFTRYARAPEYELSYAL